MLRQPTPREHGQLRCKVSRLTIAYLDEATLPLFHVYTLLRHRPNWQSAQSLLTSPESSASATVGRETDVFQKRKIKPLARVKKDADMRGMSSTPELCIHMCIRLTWGNVIKG